MQNTQLMFLNPSEGHWEDFHHDLSVGIHYNRIYERYCNLVNTQGFTGFNMNCADVAPFIGSLFQDETFHNKLLSYFGEFEVSFSEEQGVFKVTADVESSVKIYHCFKDLNKELITRLNGNGQRRDNSGRPIFVDKSSDWVFTYPASLVEGVTNNGKDLRISD